MKMLCKTMCIDPVIPKALRVTLIYLNTELLEKNPSRPCQNLTAGNNIFL